MAAHGSSRADAGQLGTRLPIRPRLRDRPSSSSGRPGTRPPSWDALTRHLRALGFPDTVLEASGLARRSRRGTLIDTFRNRAMLPIRSADGTMIAFIGRAPDRSGPGVPKYLNSPQTACTTRARSCSASGRHEKHWPPEPGQLSSKARSTPSP